MKKYHSKLNKKYPRYMVGYGSRDIKVKWPNNARIALQLVLNYEEGLLQIHMLLENQGILWEIL